MPELEGYVLPFILCAKKIKSFVVYWNVLNK